MLAGLVLLGAGLVVLVAVLGVLSGGLFFFLFLFWVGMFGDFFCGFV